MEWQFFRNGAKHHSGLKVRFEPLPHGTRGKHVAFQIGTKRYIAIIEQMPEGLDTVKARKAIAQAGVEWGERLQRRR